MVVNSGEAQVNIYFLFLQSTDNLLSGPLGPSSSLLLPRLPFRFTGLSRSPLGPVLFTGQCSMSTFPVLEIPAQVLGQGLGTG